MPPRMKMYIGTPIYKPAAQPQLSMGNMMGRINGVKSGCGSCGK